MPPAASGRGDIRAGDPRGSSAAAFDPSHLDHFRHSPTRARTMWRYRRSSSGKNVMRLRRAVAAAVEAIERPMCPRGRARRDLPPIESLEPRVLLSATLVKDVNDAFAGASSNPASLLNVDGTLFFLTANTADFGSGANALYRSDGTAAGTQQLSKTGIYGGGLTAVGHLVYFVGDDKTLWVSDGTAAGTRAIKSIGFFPQGMTQLNGLLYFCERNDGSN